jgi:hypothetical protein
MHWFDVVCYAAGAACFLFSVVRHKFAPTSLDFIALGLFFVIMPTLIDHINRLM